MVERCNDGHPDAVTLSLYEVRRRLHQLVEMRLTADLDITDQAEFQWLSRQEQKLLGVN